MRHGEWPRPQTHLSLAGGAAEVHVVEVERKARIEPHATLDERRPARGEEHAIEQLALGGRRVNTKVSDRAKRSNVVCDCTAEVVRGIRPEIHVYEGPRGLSLHTATVAGDADDVERL